MVIQKFHYQCNIERKKIHYLYIISKNIAHIFYKNCNRHQVLQHETEKKEKRAMRADGARAEVFIEMIQI